MKRFFRDDRGYALVLTLVFLPALLGLSLLMIDVGRGNNAHSDHQAAADALALAGARELDGGPDAIVRAKAAMDNFTNSVSYLARSGADTQIDLQYADTAGNAFTVIFLTAIPPSDDTPIDQAWVDANRAATGAAARFVYVRSQVQDMDGFFFNPVTFLRQTVPVGAKAVATYRSAACDVTPLFICNPFEQPGDTPDTLQQSFAEGKLHGRLIKLRPKGSNTALPGNFGFLSAPDADGTTANGAKVLTEMLAGRPNPSCYEAGTVETQTGAVTSVRTGLNTRMDMYEGSYRKALVDYKPALAVRKGYTYNGQACRAEPETNTSRAFGFPVNGNWQAGGGITGGMVPGDGAILGWGNWDVEKYLQVNFGMSLGQAKLAGLSSTFNLTGTPNSTTLPGATVPSRYDVYRWEIAAAKTAVKSGGSNQGETGNPACYVSKGNNLNTLSDSPDRRTLFAAIIDCVKYKDDLTNKGGGKVSLPVNSFASIFLANPMDKNAGSVGACNQTYTALYGNKNTWTDAELAEWEECVSGVSNDQTIDVEIVDITGSGSNGTLEAFLREEAFLVR